MHINFATIEYQISSLNNLFDQAFNDFYGSPGVPSDLKGLFYVANAMARMYKQLILWTIEINSTLVEDMYVPIKNVLASFPESALVTIWEYPTNTLTAIDDGIKLYAENQLPNKIEAILTLVIEDNKVESFSAEIKRLESLYSRV